MVAAVPRTPAPPGLRERKAAATRLALVERLRIRLGDAEFADIAIDELTDDANVSRMTFFNYFPTKEDALALLMAIWMFRLQAELVRRALRGVAAIEFIFASTGDEVADNPRRWRTLFGHHLLRPDRALPPLGRADRAVIAPELADVEVAPVGLGHLLLQTVEEIRADGGVLIGSSYEIAHYLGALLHGASLIGSDAETDHRRLLRRHVRRALGLLGGAHDPPPPPIPRRYRTATPRGPRARTKDTR